MAAENGTISVPDLARDIASRGDTLLQEMEQLRERYHDLKGSHQNIPGLSSLVDAVEQERKSAQLFLDPQKDGQDGMTTDGRGSVHVEARPAEARLRFTNLPAIERNWNIVKRCRNLVSVEQSIPKVPKVGVKENGGLIVHRQGPGKGKKGTDMTFVHAVTDGGAEWLRIVSKDEKRIMLELAAGGWDWGWDSDDEEEPDEEEIEAELLEDIPLLRTAKELADTARQYWHDYHRPRIRILLTAVEEGQSKELDRVIQKMRRVGGDDITVTVDCAGSAWFTENPQPDVDAALVNLVPAGIGGLGSTVLLDTSVLIALASDLSHSNVEVQPWHSIDCKVQIQDEANGINFLRLQAYPPLRGRRLVCTKEAVVHFREITSTIASPTELERARILFEDGPEEYQKLSVHPVPADLMLPVRILDEETDLHAQDLVDKDELPDVAVQVENHLLYVPGNRATHLYGWRTGTAVVTSNRALAKRMVRMVESSLKKDYEDGPKIYHLPYNRALSTKGPKQDD